MSPEISSPQQEHSGPHTKNVVATKYFGCLEYDADSVFHFPAGLPGFEHEKFFVPIDPPAVRPLIFLQSLTHPDLCFITVPLLLAAPHYELDVSAEDRELIGLAGEQPLKPGENVVCLAIATLREEPAGTPHAAVNLMAPIVVNPSCGLAVQAVRRDARYPAQYPLPL